MTGRRGFTILEVLIFIAVSALIFVTAMTAISGRQNQVQYSQGTRDFETKMRDIINDVTTGFFPTNETVGCEVGVGLNDEVQIVSSFDSTQLGTNNDCIYIGKVIQFVPDGQAEKIRVYVMAGRRYINNEDVEPVTTIAESKPKLVYLPEDTNLQDTYEEYTLLYGMKVTRVFQPNDSGPVEYGAVAVISNFGGSLTSESQTVQVGGIAGTSLGSELGNARNDALNIINRLTDDEAFVDDDGYFEKNTDNGIVVCLENFEGKKASVGFGARGSTSTTLQLDDYNEECDE